MTSPTPAPAPAPAHKAKEPPSKLTMRSWPKMIAMWPMLVISLVMAICQHASPDQQQWWGGIWMAAFALLMIVQTLEFPRGTSVTLALGIAAVVLGLFLLNQWFSVIGPIERLFSAREIYASTEFYYSMFVLGLLLWASMYAATRFDYWELTPNELVHHRGLLGDIERYSTAGLKMTKEIADIFEYFLVRSGRVVINLPSSPRPIVLDNVIRIDMVQRVSDIILERRVVQVARGKLDLQDMEQGAAMSEEENS